MRRRSLDPTHPAAARGHAFRTAGEQSADYAGLFTHDGKGAGDLPGPTYLSKIVAVALAAATVLIAAGSPARAVANGSVVPDGKYAFAVKLTDIGIPTASGGRRNSSCSGALIAPHWVLTAGHCFRDVHDNWVSRPVARRSTATVGRTDLTGTGGHEANVIAVRQQGTADVSLAELDRAVTDITPVRVGRSRPKVGQSVRLTGYGLTRADATELPTRLLTGRFRVSSIDPLEIGMSGTAPHADTSPCPHDSGGPYFTEDPDGGATVVAVVSHGPDCPHTGPDTAARIDAVSSWIRSVIGPDLPASKAPTTRPAPHESSSEVADPMSPSDRTATPPYWLIVPVGGLVSALALAAWWARIARRRGAHRPGPGRPGRRPSP